MTTTMEDRLDEMHGDNKGFGKPTVPLTDEDGFVVANRDAFRLKVERKKESYRFPNLFENSDNMPGDPEQAAWDEHGN